MRILNVTESYAPFYEFGGPPVKVQALSEGLVARGHEVTVLTADWGVEKREKEKPSTLAPDRSPFGWRSEKSGVCAIYLPTWVRYRAVTWNPALKRFCRARLANFDVVHIFGLYDLLGPAVAAFCRKRGIPYALEPIGMFAPIVRSFRLKRLYHTFFGRKMFDGASAVVATAEQEREDFLRGGVADAKIVLRRNGVMPPEQLPPRGSFRSAHGFSADARLVLFLGRLSAKKSPELLLRAFASLPTSEAGEQRQLVIAGPDESGMRKRLQEAAAKLGVAGTTRFFGPLIGDEKWAAYRDADVFVLPSQNENFGNTAAEAAAAGTPVILTENCGIASLFSGGAALVIPHEQNALTQAIANVLGDSRLHERLSAEGKQIAARLGWEEPIMQMESLYGTLAAARPGVGQSDRRE
ncbi:MAG TPA: glycosyltransferase [Terriglobales bacterium]|nr:glycosyltransferase [Terriglobales bacterium]